jgi:abortive infection Abi-like protein
MIAIPKRDKPRAPVNDAIIAAVARLVDDSQCERRDPSHSEIEFEIKRAGLVSGDPTAQGYTVGKAKRIRSTLSWGLEHAPNEAEIFLAALIALIRGKGGFRRNSPNFVGEDAIAGATDAFRTEGFILSVEGELYAANIDTLAGNSLTTALEAYVRRALRGSEDAALLVGTSKDLLEATAAHVISERFGSYPQQANFPTLLGQAFAVLGLATPAGSPPQAEPPQRRLERSLYEAGCSINALRNKQGTGHGRPWVAALSDFEARAAIQVMGIVSGYLLAAHQAKP